MLIGEENGERDPSILVCVRFTKADTYIGIAGVLLQEEALSPFCRSVKVELASKCDRPVYIDLPRFAAGAAGTVPRI